MSGATSRDRARPRRYAVRLDGAAADRGQGRGPNRRRWSGCSTVSPAGASEATRISFRTRFDEGHLDGAEVEVEINEAPSAPFEIPGMAGQVGMINLSDMMGKAFGQQPKKKRRLKVREAWTRLCEEEADKRLDSDDVPHAVAEAEATARLPRRDRQTRSRKCAAIVSARAPARCCPDRGTTVATKYGR